MVEEENKKKEGVELNTQADIGPDLKEQEPPKKKKLIIAKNKKEAVIAIIVMIVFIANTIYMIANYLIQNKTG